MKKVILLFTVLFNIDLVSCNLCLQYTNTGTGSRLQQMPIERVECNCECWKYPHTQGTNDPYICTNCQHRLLPEKIKITKADKKYPTYSLKRYETKLS